MWKRMFPFLIVLSVALNIAFVGVWLGHAAKRRQCHGVSQRCMGGNDKIACPLHREIGTSREQWKQIGPRLAEFRKATRTICRDLSKKRAEMIDLLAQPQVDSEAIAAKREEILAEQRTMQQLVIDHLLAEKEVLTTEQQKKFFDLFRRQCGGPGCAGVSNLPCQRLFERETQNIDRR